MTNIALFFFCWLFYFVLQDLPLLVLGQTNGRDVFQVLDGPKAFSTITDIIHFKPNDYTNPPHSFPTSDLLNGGDLKQSVAFWVKHNFTTLTSTITLIRAASTTLNGLTDAYGAHFMVELKPSGSDVIINLRFFVNGNTGIGYEYNLPSTSPLTKLKAYTWYGIFISRQSAANDRATLFVYDAGTKSGTNYASTIQTELVVTTTATGYQKTGATTDFYIDIGGDSKIGPTVCNCQIANFNFFYKNYYSVATDILELIRRPPRLLLWLKYEETDSTLQLVKDSSDQSNVVIRGESQFDTNRDTQLYSDQTVTIISNKIYLSKANSEIGHVYSQNGFDTIYPAFDLGREFTIAFWIKFNPRPSSVTVDSPQTVFFKQNSLYPKMQLYVAFEATTTDITKIKLQSGLATVSETLPATMSRSDNTWYYFSVYFGNFYKNESLTTFQPTTLYTIRFSKPDGTMTKIENVLNDYFVHGGTTDIMRIGMGVDGQNQNLYAVIKQFQIFSGSWGLDLTAVDCLFAFGGDRITHITDGLLSSKIYCQKCSGTNNLYNNDCISSSATLVCPAGTYAVTTDSKFTHCELCYENCQACSGRKGQQCSSCFFGSWDPFGVLNCPGKNPCNSHQYSDQLVCQECQDQCANCKDDTSCTACSQGYSYKLTAHSCEVPTCGDGVVVAGEQCDDGNRINGDGCTSDCKVEVGFYCNYNGGQCYSICGDNVRASNEECDDGNGRSGDGCSYNCTVEEGYYCTKAPQIGPFTDLGASATYRETCAQCAGASCKKCSSANTCSVCKTSFYLDGTSCVATCTTPGTYQDAASQSCLPCPNLCSKCTDATHCIECTLTNALYNNKCLDTCPDGTYNGGTAPTRQCLTCPSHCLKCGSATSCYTCETGYFLQNPGASGTCVGCHGTCQTCRGPNSNDCILCSQGLTLQKSTSTCIILNCLANQYANFDIGECQNCDASCATCINTLSTGCLTCSSDKALSLSNRCLTCSTQNGLTLVNGVCQEICGDGKHVKKTTECDDGNTDDGDGCSSTCKVESGWTCTGGSEISADKCISYVGPKPIILVDEKNPTSFQISFDKKVINTLQEKEFLTQIAVVLEGIEEQNQSYQIYWDSNLQAFTIIFDLKESVLDSVLSVQFKSPQRITDLFQNPVAVSTVKQTYPTYYYVDQNTKNIASGLSTASLVIQGINTATIIPLSLTGYLNHYWIFLEYFQIAYDLRLINVRTPYLADKFFNSFRYMQLSWLPNAPKAGNNEFDRSKQVGNDKFSDEEISTYFLENAGYQLTTWAFLLALWALLKVVIKVGFKRSILKIMVYYLMINLEWSIILRAVIETYFDFCIFTFLQLSKLSSAEGILTFSSILAIIATIFIALFPILSIKKVLSVKNEYLVDRDTKFDTLYREFKKKKVSTIIFLSIILLQKIIIAALLVGLQYSPEAQIALLTLTQVIMIMLHLLIRPYVDGSMNFRAVIQEFSLFAIFALFYGLLDENTDEKVRDNVGIVIVALLIMTLLMHFAFLIKDSYLAIKEHLKTPQDSRKIFSRVRITPGQNGQDEFQLNNESNLNSTEQIVEAKNQENLTPNKYQPLAPTSDDIVILKGKAPTKYEGAEESLFS